MRTSGVLLPVFSLPSPHGIGCFSKEAYEWVDFLKLAGQQYWQILPLGPTSYGDSPYQSFSTYAGNPYFIDLEELVEAGFLTRKEVEACECGKAARDIDFGKLYEKPTLGDPDRPVVYEDITRANRLLYGTAILALLVFGLVKGVVLWPV